MPRKNKNQVLAARQDAAAPFLFDEESLPHKPQWVEAVKQKRYVVTGARLMDDDDKIIRLVDLLLRRPPLGLRKIARALGCSRETIRAVREELVTQGKLKPYKERVVALYEDFLESSIAEMVRKAEDGFYPIPSIALHHGIIADKRALALGEATSISISGTAQLRPEALSVARLNEFLRNGPTEGESSGNAPISEQSGTIEQSDATLDATESKPGVGPDPAAG